MKTASYGKRVRATDTNSGNRMLFARVKESTNQRGVDCAIEVVVIELNGIFVKKKHCQRKADILANVGVHGKSNFLLKIIGLKKFNVNHYYFSGMQIPQERY
jgi:threonine dehydrogenase-like Zn-dependent dehydrogenase